MKKIEQIENYYCDYCGKECEHTPEYIIPTEEKFYAKMDGLTVAHFETGNIVPEQKDICPECKRKIAMLVGLRRK